MNKTTWLVGLCSVFSSVLICAVNHKTIIIKNTDPKKNMRVSIKAPIKRLAAMPNNTIGLAFIYCSALLEQADIAPNEEKSFIVDLNAKNKLEATTVKTLKEYLTSLFKRLTIHQTTIEDNKTLFYVSSKGIMRNIASTLATSQ